MKNLAELKLDAHSCTWYSLAKQSTKKKAARKLRRKFLEKYIHTRYTAFEKIVENFNNEPEKCLKKSLGEQLQDFYYHPPKHLKEVLQFRRNKHNLQECPSCGNPLAPDTLDHFLPKEDWPEYSIFPNNLMPQCRGCAPIKGRKYYSKEKGAVYFLHPMYTNLLEEVRFKIDIGVNAGVVEFSVCYGITDKIEDDDKIRIERHMEELQINQRIQEFCIRHHTHWKCNLAENGGDIGIIFSSLLGGKIYDTWGRNWAIAFMLGALRNPKVILDLQLYSSTTPLPAPETVTKIK